MKTTDTNSETKKEAADLVDALKERVLWDLEIGLSGYSKGDSLKQPVSQSSLKSLEDLQASIGDCTRCPLHQGRTNLVFGEGAPNAKLVFVGEGPGFDEDQSGRPFVGAAGQLLNKIISAIGFKREDVYICNVVKCRPPNNRAPLPEEASMCGPFMRRQTEIISPDVIVALGRPAAHFILNEETPISRLRGSFVDLDGIMVMPTYHPAYLLRNPSAKRSVWEDMKMVRDHLNEKAQTR